MLLNRRQLIGLAPISVLGTNNTGSSLQSVTVTPSKIAKTDHILVSIFLRGGADGLSIVAPYADDLYYQLRPTIAISSPNDNKAPVKNRLMNLDGYFGLHPSLRALYPIYERGEMAVVHACGSGDITHSHFEAMAAMERGLYGETGPSSGWLARHLSTTPWVNTDALRAVAIGNIMPQSLSGAPSSVTVNDIADIKLIEAFPSDINSITESLSSLYSESYRGIYTGTADASLFKHAGSQALSTLKKIEEISSNPTHLSNVSYPNGPLGNGLRQIATLIKGAVDIEVACLDCCGWDTHFVQGGAAGALSEQLFLLGNSIDAFIADLGRDNWRRVSIVVQTEFGRRVEENSSAGTDHGHGGVMLVLSGSHINGGKIHGHWPGIHNNSLFGPGDLAVTTDYRNVLAEILKVTIGNDNVNKVFPGLTYSPIGVMKSV